MPDARDTETLAEVLKDGLARHWLARPYGEPTAWCTCLHWSTERTSDQLADVRAYEAHVSADLAARIVQARAGEGALREVLAALDVEWQNGNVENSAFERIAALAETDRP